MKENQWEFGLDLNDAAAYSNRGRSYHELGQYQQSIEDYDKAIDLDPDDATYYINRGISYGDLGQQHRAIEDFDKAIELDPNHATPSASREMALRALDESI